MQFPHPTFPMALIITLDLIHQPSPQFLVEILIDQNYNWKRYFQIDFFFYKLRDVF